MKPGDTAIYFKDSPFDVTVCPQCGSNDVRRSFRRQTFECYDLYYMIWICADCESCGAVYVKQPKLSILWIPQIIALPMSEDIEIDESNMVWWKGETLNDPPCGYTWVGE